MGVGGLAGWLFGTIATAVTVTMLAASFALGQQPAQSSAQTLTLSHPSDAAELTLQPTDVTSGSTVLKIGSTVLKSGVEGTAAVQTPVPVVIPVAATVNGPPNATVVHSPTSASVASEAAAMLMNLLPLTQEQRLKFQQGVAVFPSFCHDWERRLHDRELDNVEHLTWQTRDGYQTATYVGYSTIESCETKPTRTTLIGKLTYDELYYYIVGKTVDEAKHSKPKLIGKTNTLEIFSWESNRWFY
jgi:hypothetical protein